MDRKAVDLDTVISWSYGFPFCSIMSYSSYDEKAPDYMVADWLPVTLFAGDLEAELFTAEGIEGEFTLPELHKDGSPVSLFDKTGVRSYPHARLNMSSHPELYILFNVCVWNGDYYISFYNSVFYYKITEDFLSSLRATDLID